MGEQPWIVGTTKVVLWLQLGFSLSKGADSTATGAGVLVPPLHKTLLPTEQAHHLALETARLSPISAGHHHHLGETL
jgi:hypothetical protein